MFVLLLGEIDTNALKLVQNSVDEDVHLFKSCIYIIGLDLISLNVIGLQVFPTTLCPSDALHTLFLDECTPISSLKRQETPTILQNLLDILA